MIWSCGFLNFSFLYSSIPLSLSSPSSTTYYFSLCIIFHHSLNSSFTRKSSLISFLELSAHLDQGYIELFVLLFLYWFYFPWKLPMEPRRQLKSPSPILLEIATKSLEIMFSRSLPAISSPSHWILHLPQSYFLLVPILWAICQPNHETQAYFADFLPNFSLRHISI